MILANKLRIGNYLYSNLTKTVFQVYAEDIESINGDPQCCNPIELTEELLIKIGFVYVDNQEHYVLNRVIFNKGMTMMFYSSSKGDVQYARLKAPKYLHDLQNAWPILTGQELPISLNI